MLRLTLRTGILLALGVTSLSCGATKVLMPPRVDLRSYAPLAIVEFSVENAKGTLHELATETFTGALLSAQPGIEIFELGNQDSVLARIGEGSPGASTARELAKDNGAGGVFFGHLKISKPETTGGLTALLEGHIETTIRMDLTVRLVSTKTGATAWRASSWVTQEVAGLSFENGRIDVTANDPGTTYGPMVDDLVELVTEDLRSSWQ